MSKKQKQQELKKLQQKKKIEETKKLIKDMAQQTINNEYFDKMISIKSLSQKQNKKIKKEIIQESKIEEQQPLQFNIFQQNFEQKSEHLEKQQVKQEIVDLEISVKRIIPELSFEQLDKKQIQIIEDKQDKIEQESSEEQDEFIQDETLQKILLNQNSIYRNTINRNQNQETSRKELPIYMRENDIIDIVNHNLITIISGQTGCGKSTQVPQFLYEAGYSHPDGYNPGLIGITQPRRIAAISLSQRLSEEMNVKLGDEVAYQVRHESSNYSEKTRIKFQTDGILLNEMTSDFLLSKYCVIIIDEAHERKTNSDLLLGLLSRVVSIRAKMALKFDKKIGPLRLIIMSATLRIEELLENKNLFKQKIPVIDIETRQFPVQCFYEKITIDNYMELAVKKTVKIHKKLPPGNILIFLTGENEIKQFCYLLNLQIKNTEYDFSSDDDLNTEKEIVIQDYKIFPLYSKLTPQEQQEIFKKNENFRVIIASTNVAETSLTIPGIKYVVDCGKAKSKIFSENLEIMSFKIDWISQASADQRLGRAGRLGPGICYRLYSNAVYANIFQKHGQPEIMQTPLESVILQLKAIGIQDVYKFPFPTMPDQSKLEISHQNLMKLKAIDKEGITELGKILAYIPLSPKYSKLLLLTRNSGILGYGILLVSALSTEELIKHNIQQNNDEHKNDNYQDEFSEESQDVYQKQITQKKKEQEQKQSELRNKRFQVNEFKQKYSSYIQLKSDLFMKINILGYFMQTLSKQKFSFQELDQQIYSFAMKNQLLSKNLKEVYENIQQIIQILDNLVDNKHELQLQQFFQNYQQPDLNDQKQIIQCICSIFIDKIAKKITLYNKNNQPYTAYECLEINQIVHIPSLSVVYQQKPEFVIYTHIQLNNFNQRYYLQNLTNLEDVSYLYLFDYNQSQLDYLKTPSPYYCKISDRIIVYCSTNFRQWKLPNFPFQYQNDEIDKYYIFAKCLLEGQIFDFFKALKKVYSINTNDIKFTNLNPKISAFVNQLKYLKLDSKQKLGEKWKNQQSFLLQELLSLVKTENQKGVQNQWPPKF